MSDMKDTKKHAVVYRMVMPDHLCPFGQKTLHYSKNTVTPLRIIILRPEKQLMRLRMNME
jgi:hypothetical protein